MSHTTATEFFRNLGNTCTRSDCNFGPALKASFKLIPSHFAAASKTIRTRDVDFSDRKIGNVGEATAAPSSHFYH